VKVHRYRSRRYRSPKYGSTLIAAVLLAAGCASGSGGSGGTGGSGSDVTIGLIALMTGTRADLGKGMQLGADAVNAAGGVLGHHLNLVTQDDVADPVDAVPAAQVEINSNHVVAFVGPTSITAGVVIPLAQKAKIPDLMFGGGSQFDAETNPFFFRLSPSDSQQAEAMIYYAHTKGWNHVALAFDSSSGSQALVPSVITAAKQLGVTINNVSLTPSLTSYRSEISTIFSGHPQAVLSQVDNTTASVLFGEVKQQGLSSTPWIGTNLWFDQTWFKAVTTAVATGPIYIANSSSAGMLGATAFLQILTAKTGQSVPPNGAEFMYDAVITWALGADEAGTWSWPNIRSGILAASDPPGTQCGDYAACYALRRGPRDPDRRRADRVPQAPARRDHPGTSRPLVPEGAMNPILDTDILDIGKVDFAYGGAAVLRECTFGIQPGKVTGLLLLDEPTAGVFPQVVQLIAERIKEMVKGEGVVGGGITVLVVAHNMAFLESIADDVVVMDQGTMLTRGPVEEVRANADVVSAYLGVA
jgi:branched-chain amino acid transport system substrate-binding protein